ncbi:hypothetical protein C8J56DRAFT_917364 [Mycena floridula]|nr:hypothetical protein C8J56DRAFT_917364 [Mycena floridula]
MPLKLAELAVGVSDVQKIIDLHLGDDKRPISSLKEQPNPKLLYRAVSKAYLVELAEPAVSFVLTIELPRAELKVGLYRPNSLKEIYDLISTVEKERKDDMGAIPNAVAYDETCSIIQFPYLLQGVTIPRTVGDEFYVVSITEARNRIPFEKISVVQSMMGRSIAAYNSVENSSGRFGLAECEDVVIEGSDSWRETFTKLIRALLDENEAFDKKDPARLQGQNPLSYEFIRARLALDSQSAHIFDEVTTPKLVIFPTYEDDAFAIIDATDPDPLPLLAGIQPRFDYALWGDPLMESSLRISNADPNILEGYNRYGREELKQEDLDELFLQPNVHLRRMWYDIFFHLFIMAADGESEETLALKKDSREWVLVWSNRMETQIRDLDASSEEDASEQKETSENE